MKEYWPWQGLFGERVFKSRRSTIIWLSLLSIVLIPALACNLPGRQAGGLSFPTDQASMPSPDLPFPTSAITSATVLTEVPAFPTSALSPGESPNPFQGLLTATPGAGVPTEWTTPEPGEILAPFTYWSQSGDTLLALAARFGVSPDQISPAQPLYGLLQPGQQLTIPNLLGEPAYPSPVFPDSLVINSPAADSFQTDEYVTQAGGYLSTYREKLDTGEWLSGAEIVQRVASESSINPQLLLAVLEFRSGWVRGEPTDPSQVDYPIGFYVPDYHGLYMELSLVAKELNIGYYGWRQGTLTELVFPSNIHVRISPGLNAGSVAVQNLLSKFYLHQQNWLEAVYGQQGILADYQAMFGNPWQKAANFEPLFPSDLVQPTLELPFMPGEDWSLTSGPHIAWRTGTPRGALDFAPITGEPACAVSTVWVTASAPGLVVRSERGIVTLDLDGDGLEQTGWVLLYMHVADQGRVAPGTRVQTDTPLGHPSCEGGQASGTHVHLARKYNGEWLAADGPLPMVLSGWIAHVGELSYEGTLVKDGRTVSAHPDGSSGSTIIR
jgi:murein DD-endopeptidase MepM/ murein hydrolase activator NlpD